MSYRKNYRTRSRSSIHDLKIAKKSIFDTWIEYWRGRQDERVQQTADIVCHVDGESYRVHSKLISFWSPNFEKKFERDVHNIVTIPTIKRSQFEIIIEYIYSADLKLTARNILEVLHAAECLEIDSVTEACKYYVISNAKILDNIFDIYQFLGNKPNSQVYSEMKTGLLKSWRYIRRKTDIDTLSFYDLRDLVKRLSESSKKWSELIEICSDWVLFNFETRAGYVSELIRCICRRPVECDGQKLVKEDLGNEFCRIIYACYEDDHVRFAESLGLTRQNRTDFHEDDEPLESPEIFYYRSWQKRMKILRNQNQSDLTVHVKTKTYFLDTWVLCISSRFFQTVVPSPSIEIDLEEDDFETVLNYMYGKNLHITIQNVEGILRTYYYLQIDSIKTLIISFLKENLTHTPNIFKLLEMSLQNRDEIRYLLKSYFLRNFSEISQNENVCNLSKNCLNILLPSNMARLSNEQKFALCETWIKDDFENRSVFADELLHSMNCSINEMSQFHARLNKIYLPIVMNEEVDFEVEINNDDEKKLEHFAIPFVIMIPEFDGISSKESKEKPSQIIGNKFFIQLKQYDFSNVNFKN